MSQNEDQKMLYSLIIKVLLKAFKPKYKVKGVIEKIFVQWNTPEETQKIENTTIL